MKIHFLRKELVRLDIENRLKFANEKGTSNKKKRSAFGRPFFYFQRRYRSNGNHMHHTAAYRQGPDREPRHQRYYRLCGQSAKDRPRQAHHRL